MFNIRHRYDPKAYKDMPKMLGSAPSPWWNAIEDRDLMLGICKHGYLQYSKLWSDPELSFKARFEATNGLILTTADEQAVEEESESVDGKDDLEFVADSIEIPVKEDDSTHIFDDIDEISALSSRIESAGSENRDTVVKITSQLNEDTTMQSNDAADVHTSEAVSETNGADTSAPLSNELIPSITVNDAILDESGKDEDSVKNELLKNVMDLDKAPANV